MVALAVALTVVGAAGARAQDDSARDAAAFPDIPSSAYFAVPVGVMARAGVFFGTECDDGFCPAAPMDRSTMAVWMVRVLDGTDPESVTSTRFGDVDATHPHAAFIERLADIGVTSGCGDGTNFCPNREVTRAQMAVFLSRAYGLPEGPDPGFGDVSPDAWYASDVARLAAADVTGGCGDGTNFCPGRSTTRGQMATFLYRAEVRARQPCMPAGFSHLDAGFPLPDFAAPSVGRVKLAVLFMDFPDAQATYTTHEETEPGLRYMEQYLEAGSYGRLDLEIDIVHRWWRSPTGYESFTDADAAGASGLWPSASTESIRLADAAYDFSETDIVMTVFPSAHFGGGLALGTAEADGRALSTFRINTHPNTGTGAPSNWGLIAAHELAHNFGLPDLYPYDPSVQELPDPPVGTTWAEVEFGLLGLHAWFPTSEFIWFATPVEMLAWSRWQLGWLDPLQVRCGIGTASTVLLQPVAQPGRGTVMVVVPLNEYEMIVIENRRMLGYDAGTPETSPSGTVPGHGLLEEGVLVYTVDSRLSTGEVPTKIAGDPGNAQFSEFPVLGLGESVTVRGYTIRVTAETGNTYTIVVSLDTANDP
ncbi:MAG: S-layer homology domain-containing protein [Acidimicrobiaceae bacterium]|nr:S-layer homology domain-containing protein [Acidimicrobiaceae bacterium]